MKLNKIIVAMLIIASGTTALTSCNSFLEENPDSFIGPDNLGDSKEAVDTWVTGVYSNWIDDMFRWSEFPRVLELDADYISGPDWLFGSMGAGNFQAESSLSKMWKGPYSLINRTNVAIRYINKMSSVDEAYKNNALGELYFNKAFAYFLLVRAYGPIPLFDTDIANGEDRNQPRRPVSVVYQEIINLLTKAANMMYKRDNANYQTGHVCAGSAAGLLAKVYATMASAAEPAGTVITIRSGAPYQTVGGTQIYTGLSDVKCVKDTVAGYTNIVINNETMDYYALYRKAAEWAKKVIDGDYGYYELLPYNELWSRSHNNDSEFMFSVQAVSGNSTYKNGIHTYYEGVTNSAGVITEGNWVGCTRHWYDLFDSQDYRIVKGVKHRFIYSYQVENSLGFYYPQNAEWTLKATGYDADGNKVADPVSPFNDGINYYYNQTNECLAFTTKYDDVTDASIEETDVQWPFLRYADVILIYAEAENELGNYDTSVKYLNMVRERSNATLAGSYNDKILLRNAILEERAKEFACEADRRWDLIRWGIYLDAMNCIGRDDANNVKTRTSKHLLYPIPTDEINTNKAITTNNPGWN